MTQEQKHNAQQCEVRINIPLTLSRGCWELTIHVVDLEAGQVLGSAGLRGREQRRVMDWKVAVVVLYDGESRPLNAVEEKKNQNRSEPTGVR